jgi:hypothetical protein
MPMDNSSCLAHLLGRAPLLCAFFFLSEFDESQGHLLSTEKPRPIVPIIVPDNQREERLPKTSGRICFTRIEAVLINLQPFLSSI